MLILLLIFSLMTFPARSAPYKAGTNSGYAMDELNLTGTNLVEMHTKSQKVETWPNPARPGETVYIAVSDKSFTGFVTLYCIGGRIMFSHEVKGGVFNLNTELQTGTYILHLTGRDGAWQNKLMVR